MNIRKILVPVLFTEDCRHAAAQAAWLQRRFCAEIILLHVVPPLHKRDNVLESLHDMQAQGRDVEIAQQAQADLDRALRREIDGNAVTRLLLKGTPGMQIMNAAREHDVDLIMMTSHDRWRTATGARAFYFFLLKSVTAMVLEQARCPVWVGLPQPDESPHDFSIRHILCQAEFGLRGRRIISRAAALAAAIDAKLSLVHVTTGAELYGPGGLYIHAGWKLHFESTAARKIAKIQRDLGIDVDVIIHSGNVPKLLNQIAEQNSADLLVIGNFSAGSDLEDVDDGFKIIQEARLPVLSM